MESAEVPVSIQESESPKSSDLRFQPLEELSRQMHPDITTSFESKDVHPDQHILPTIYINSKRLERDGIVIPEEVLKDQDALWTFIHEQGLSVTFYGGGITWDGTQTEKAELVENPHATEESIKQKLAARLSLDLPEEKKAEAGQKLPALDFLAATGDHFCITLDPSVKDAQARFQSSLRADAIARTKVFEKLREHGIKPDIVHWSNNGFKEFQLHKSAVEVFARDIDWGLESNTISYDELLSAGESGDYESLLNRISQARQNAGEVPEPQDTPYTNNLGNRATPFDLSSEAFRYIKSLQDVDMYIGGSPASANDIAHPVFLTSSVLPSIKKFARSFMAHGVLKGLGKLDALTDTRKTPGLKKLEQQRASRTTEIGRSRGLQIPNDSFVSWAHAFAAANQAFGDARVVSLGDTSGKVVLSDRFSLAKDMMAIYGSKIIPIQTKDKETFTSYIEDSHSRDKIAVISGPAEHSEIKRLGVLKVLRDIVRRVRKPETTAGQRNPNHRYTIVDITAEPDIEKRGVHHYTPIPIDKFLST